MLKIYCLTVLDVRNYEPGYQQRPLLPEAFEQNQCLHFLPASGSRPFLVSSSYDLFYVSLFCTFSIKICHWIEGLPEWFRMHFKILNYIFQKTLSMLRSHFIGPGFQDVHVIFKGASSSIHYNVSSKNLLLKFEGSSQILAVAAAALASL